MSALPASAVELIAMARERGLVLRVDGALLRCTPRRLMTAELADAMRQQKPAIVALLQAEGTTWPPLIAQLLETGLLLDRAAAAGEPVDRGLASEVVAELAGYVSGLPLDQRQAMARCLVAALNGQAPLTSGRP